eukprot:GHVS01102897.1.p1 GENE.GHVS01102897.1~~GHVS01102897.1.p1  ORF type:complete len:261 (+),score=55.96 GHVS01102897.1:65-847(+)
MEDGAWQTHWHANCHTMLWHSCLFVLFTIIPPAHSVLRGLKNSNRLLGPSGGLQECPPPLLFVKTKLSSSSSAAQTIVSSTRTNWPIKTPSLSPPRPVRVPEKSIYPYHFLCLDYPTGYDGLFGDRPPEKASSSDIEGKKRQAEEEKTAEEALTEIKRNPIRLYISPCCPFCDKVMNFLREERRLEKLVGHGMKLTPIRDLEDIYVVNIDGNRLIEKTGGKVQVPALELENRVMVYESVVIMKLLSTYLRVKDRWKPPSP